MSAVCRFTTVAALLLHLIFGCSLHHAVACGYHDHGGCQHTCSVAVSQSVHEGHGCGHDHDHESSREHKSSEDQTGELSDQVSQLVAPCCACESRPCEGNHRGCHSEVECSFVPSSDVVFIIDAPFVAFVTYEHDPMMSTTSWMAKQGLHQRSAWIGADSLAHCATLCTWII